MLKIRAGIKKSLIVISSKSNIKNKTDLNSPNEITINYSTSLTGDIDKKKIHN